ncbi:MAG: cation-transporting P-type ATPase, partial [Omnitrophica WOR_2 bacterium]
MNISVESQEADTSHKHTPLNGLTSVEVTEQREKYGRNTLPAEKSVSAWTILFNQLKSPLVYIILVAAGVSLIVGELGDFAIIMAVVIIDAVLGFFQEYQAQRTYTALRGLLK